MKARHPYDCAAAHRRVSSEIISTTLSYQHTFARHASPYRVSQFRISDISFVGDSARVAVRDKKRRSFSERRETYILKK